MSLSVMVTEMNPIEQGSTRAVIGGRIQGFWCDRVLIKQRTMLRNAFTLSAPVVFYSCHATSVLRMVTKRPFWGAKTGFDQEIFVMGSDGRWIKGQSGNPRGRSKRRRLFDDHLWEALSAKRGAVASIR